MTDTALATTQPQRQPFQTGGSVGALVPQTLEEGFRLAQAMAMSGMTPRDIDTPEKVLVAIMAGAELGMKPFQAVQSFAIVNGRPSLWGDGLMALALTNGLDVEEWQEGEGDSRVAYCRVTRPDNGKVVTRSYSVEMAKTAKLWGKVSASGKPSPWVTQPDRMLQMRARSFAIRDAAADVLRGMPIKEEIEDFIEAHPGIMDAQEKQQGTGLLSKLQTAQTLTEAAVDGFGIRNLDEEVADPKPEPKKRVPRKAKEEVTNGDVAERSGVDVETVAHVLEVSADIDEEIDAANAPLTPADAQVDKPATDAAPEDDTVADGHAKPGDGYFLGDKAAFPSGRRVWYVDGVEQKDTADNGTLPVYAEHAPAAVAAHESEASDALERLRSGGEPAEDLFTSEEAPADPFATFEAALTAAKSWPDLRPAVVDLSRTSEWRARPHDQKRVRLDLWDLVKTWNDAGAKLDPVDDPFLFQAYVTAEEDADAIEGTLALVQDSEWFKAASPEMQAGVGRFVMSRTQQIRGA